ncbi:MAG: pseudouridine synthase, partial [Celeribacter marinus]
MTRLIALNKPFDVLSQFTDKGLEGSTRRTLSDFVDVRDVYPAGRLDRDSEGLLLLTDDGKLQARIANPKSKMPKTYLAQVEGDIDAAAIDALGKGVMLKDGQTRPAR